MYLSKVKFNLKIFKVLLIDAVKKTIPKKANIGWRTTEESEK